MVCDCDITYRVTIVGRMVVYLMVHQQETPGPTSDVPKRTSRFLPFRARATTYGAILLLLVNVSVAHTIGLQLAPRTIPSSSFVKDEEVSAATEVELSSDQSTEDMLSSTEDSDGPTITTYIVQKGDTLSGIAEKFGISVNTIRWANDLTEKTSKIAIGDDLVILPVSGVEYTVKKGDTLSGIALKFDASQDDILKYNDIERDAITVGTQLVIPGAEPLVVATPKTTPKTSTKPTSSKTVAESTTSKTSTVSDTSGYAVPVRGILTQGIHDRSAVDFGVPVGTAVNAFKDGTVIVAKNSGHNGGYGSYVVINHEGSCQTQYSHLSSVLVSVGDKVSQGEMIARSGNTGRSTGPHLHFNVNNCGGNPFTKYKVGTKF